MPDDPQKQAQENSAKNLGKEKKQIKSISSQAHFYLRVICCPCYAVIIILHTCR